MGFLKPNPNPTISRACPKGLGPTPFKFNNNFLGKRTKLSATSDSSSRFRVSISSKLFHKSNSGKSLFRSMAPPKKTKKSKRESKKSKKCRSMSVVPIEPRVTESDWWDSFWQKNSPIPGFIFGSIALHSPIASLFEFDKEKVANL